MVLEEHSVTSLAGKLEILDLSQNWIHDVPTKAIKHLSNTRLLLLNHNNISSLPVRAFDGMQMLDRLALYANAITKIDSNTFLGLEWVINFINVLFC
jgi:Leucine-rich repeat (LRR) protein